MSEARRILNDHFNIPAFPGAPVPQVAHQQLTQTRNIRPFNSLAQREVNSMVLPESAFQNIYQQSQQQQQQQQQTQQQYVAPQQQQQQRALAAALSISLPDHPVPVRRDLASSSQSGPPAAVLAVAAASTNKSKAPASVTTAVTAAAAGGGVPNPEKDRPHECDFCGKRFRQGAHLKTHKEAIHLGKRHKCPICPHVASRLSNLKRHVDCIHHGKKPPITTRKCPYCEFTSHKWRAMRNHRLKEHGTAK